MSSRDGLPKRPGMIGRGSSPYDSIDQLIVLLYMYTNTSLCLISSELLNALQHRVL
jgi:hypothetical protein